MQQNNEAVKHIRALLRSYDLDGRPRATRIYVAPDVWPALRSATPDNVNRPNQYLGVTVVIDPDLPDGACKLVDQYDNTMQAWNVQP